MKISELPIHTQEVIMTPDETHTLISLPELCLKQYYCEFLKNLPLRLHAKLFSGLFTIKLKQERMKPIRKYALHHLSRSFHINYQFKDS